MLRNVQLKIILIFGIIGIIIISVIGAFYGLSLNELADVEEYTEVIHDQIRNVKYITIIAEALYGIITILIGMFISKTVLNPISKLIKDAPRIAAGENISIASTGDNKKKTSVDELTNAFDIMTNELRENLSEVNKQKKQIETILLHMTDGIIAFDMEGNITHINPAATELFKLTEEDNSFDKIFGKLNIDINLEKTVYLEDWTSLEQRATVEDRYLKIFFASFKDEKEIPSGIMVVIQDITEHVKLDNMRKEFVADVSHELKTPIALIQGYAEGLIENVNTDDESRKFYAEVILDETNKMDTLVKQLLELMKLEYGKREFNDTEFNIVELINEVIRKCKVMSEEKGIEVEFEQKSEIINVLADDFYIDQVITNYFTNAIKHAEKVDGKKQIKIELEETKENKIRIKIFNTGEKIKEEDLERIWKRFYKIDSSRNREDGGTGIGLALVKAIMANYENRFGVENKEDGVEFYIELNKKSEN